MVECFFPHRTYEKKIVIIGAGIEQVYAYQLAKKENYFVIATDNNPLAPAIEFADHFILASTRNAEETLRALKTYCEEFGNIDGVMTIANDVPYTVSYVANYFALKGHSIESSLLAHDKYLMKKAFKKHGVPCPEFWQISSLKGLQNLLLQKNIERFVLKPIDGRGARGVLLLDESSDLEWAFEESLSWSEDKVLIVERFISGMQISSESFLLDGKAYTPALSERNYSRLEEFIPYIIEDGGTIPAPIDDFMIKKINKLIEDGAKAMGVNEGIVKGDLVIDIHGEPQIIELALRLSGGWFASNQIIATSGVDLVNVVMQQALGKEINKEMLTPNLEKSTSIRYWFPRPGKIESIKGEKNLKSIPGVLKYGFFRKEGDIQPEVRMHPDRFGYVLVEGENREDSIQKVEKVLSSLEIKIKEK